MDHLKVLKRAGEITWNYRALWIFGIIFALLAGGGVPSDGPPPGGDGGNGAGGGQWPPEIPPEMVTILITVGVGLACASIILVVAATVLRYVAETALMRMVDDYEETGEKRSVRQGFRLGWSRTALRLFLLDLLSFLVVGLPFIVLFALALSPLLLWMTKNVALGVIGTVAAIGLFFLDILLAIVVSVVLSLLMLIFRRACSLDGLGVIDSIREGYGVVRRHVIDLVVMALLMLGVRIGWMLVTIPLTFLLLIGAILLVGMPALLVGGLSGLLLDGPIPWILAAVLFIPLFILIVAVPGLFLGGLMEVFKSSVWTLTYREARALEVVETAPAPALEPAPPDAE